MRRGKGGFETLSIVVWVLCKDRGRLASKSAAECVEGNHAPWVVLDKIRRVVAKYLKPGYAPTVPTEFLEQEAVAAAARTVTVYWSGLYGDPA